MTSGANTIIWANLTGQASTAPVGGIWCSQCDHEKEVSDPNGTGDHWYTQRECTAPKCPYGKLDMDMDWE